MDVPEIIWQPSFKRPDYNVHLRSLNFMHAFDWLELY